MGIARFADEAAARDFAIKLQTAGYPAVIDPVSGARDGARLAVCEDGIASARNRGALSERLKPYAAAYPRHLLRLRRVTDL